MRNWVHCNDAQWPLVVFEAPRRFTQVDLARQLADLRRCARKNEEFVVVLDLAGSTAPDADVRATWAEYRLRTLGSLDGALLGEAFVVGSRAHCGLVRALNALAPPEHLQQFFRDRTEATRWARTILARHGVAAAPPLRKTTPPARPGQGAPQPPQPPAALSLDAQLGRNR